MNNFIKKLQNRKSIRNFIANKPIDEELLKDILLAARAAPTSIYAQQSSVIVLKEAGELSKIMQLLASKNSGKTQAHIADASVFMLFVADFNKMREVLEYEGEELKVTKSIEALLIGAVDVGIAMEAASVAAEELGLGTVCIGAVRGAMEELIEYFKLPKYVLPICGLCLGYPSEEGLKTRQKLRLPLESFAFDKKYALKDFKNTIKAYNELTHEKVYNKRYIWSKNISAFYSQEAYRDNASLIKKQGFSLE